MLLGINRSGVGISQLKYFISRFGRIIRLLASYRGTVLNPLEACIATKHYFGGNDSPLWSRGLDLY